MSSAGGGGPPASSSATRTDGSSDSRAAMTAPADPAPTTTTSNCSATGPPLRTDLGGRGGRQCGTAHTRAPTWAGWTRRAAGCCCRTPGCGSPASTARRDTAWRTEDQHDPSDPLRQLTALHDRTCDGPTQPHARASRCDLDHDRASPVGRPLRGTSPAAHAGLSSSGTTAGTRSAPPPARPGPARPDAPSRSPPTGDRPRASTATRRAPRPARPDQLHDLDTDQHTPATEHPPLSPRRPGDSDDPSPC